MGYRQFNCVVFVTYFVDDVSRWAGRKVDVNRRSNISLPETSQAVIRVYQINRLIKGKVPTYSKVWASVFSLMETSCTAIPIPYGDSVHTKFYIQA